MKKKNQPKPRHPSTQTTINSSVQWQSGDFSRHASFRFCLPYQFLLLCRLMDVTPKQMLTEFMDTLAHGSWKRERSDAAREKIKQYFIEYGYGSHHYSAEEIQTIFAELNAIGMLFPKNAEPDIIQMHTLWRDKYYSYWFEKWFFKSKRNL